MRLTHGLTKVFNGVILHNKNCSQIVYIWCYCKNKIVVSTAVCWQFSYRLLTSLAPMYILYHLVILFVLS